MLLTENEYGSDLIFVEVKYMRQTYTVYDTFLSNIKFNVTSYVGLITI